MKLIVANWKMNPVSVDEAIELAKATDRENVVICPPFVFIEEVAKVVNKGKLGAQDLFWAPPTGGAAGGVVTGEVSAQELKNIGTEYVIIGHSERRQKLGETNQIVAKKFAAAIDKELIPILCVGETLEQKKSSEKEEVIKEEIISAFQNLKIKNWKLKIFIAYEPIWAISTNKNAKPDKPENTLETISFIKEILRDLDKNLSRFTHFLYGGSVNSKNAGEFLKYEEIEGALIGGASLIAEEFNKIVDIAS